MESFWKFITEGSHFIKLADDEPKSDIEKSVYSKRFNIKKNYDGFLSDVKSKKGRNKELQLFKKSNRKNEGIFAENIIRNIFKGENLNHFTKNHPYVDIAVMEPVKGVTIENELISVKSTLEYRSIGHMLRDTKAIKFDSLITFLIYAYNLEKSDSQPFNISEIQFGLRKWLTENNLTQEQYVEVYYIILEGILSYSNNYSESTISKFENKLLSNIENYISGDLDIDDIKENVIGEIKKLNSKYPVSLSVAFLGNDKYSNVNSQFGDIDPLNVLNVYKTKTLPLGDFFLSVMDKWSKSNYFGAKNDKGKYVTKYLTYSDVADVFDTTIKELFPTKIHIDLTDFEGKDKGNERQRLYVATQLKNGYFDEYEEEILNSFQKMIKELEKDPSQIKKYRDFLNDK